jgi:Flp pilus assembly protein TadD
MKSPFSAATASLLCAFTALSAAPPAEPSTPPFKSSVAPDESPSIAHSGDAAEANRLTQLGTGAFQKGDLETARKDYEKALALVPGQTNATVNLGLVAHRQKRFDEAEELLKGLVHREPELPLGWLVLGTIYYDQEKLEGALAAFAQAAFLQPKDARTHHYLGITLGKKGWYSGAEDEMRKAIELEPSYAEAHFNLAVFYLQRTPPAIELARRHYQTALDLGAPRDPSIEKTLGK